MANDAFGVAADAGGLTAARAVGFLAIRVPPDEGGTFAGTQWPSAVRCAGTYTSPGPAATGSVAPQARSATATQAGVFMRRTLSGVSRGR